MNQELQAITFDLWDTIVCDDSDEPKRKAQGLLSKREQRRYDVWEALNRQAPIDLKEVSLAYDVAEAAFNMVWREQHVNWTVKARLQVALRGLGRELPEDEFERLIDSHGKMEVDVPPDIIPGCAEALEELSSRYRLAIVSDAIVSPGIRLRELLELHGVKKYFSGFAYSDEVGHSKPHRSMFDSAAEQLGVPLESMVHIGDRDHNDIKGPHALGLRAILFTATRDADKDHTTADAICESYAQLPGIIDQLAKG